MTVKAKAARAPAALFQKSLLSLGVMALVLLGTAVTANASQSGQNLSCREPVPAVQTGSGGRWVHLWLCDNGWHGQITSVATNDSVWLVSAAGTNFGFARVPAGETSANSATVGQNGGPWRACGTLRDNKNWIACTNPN